MEVELTAALIALSGVFVSALVAYFTSIRQSKVEAARFQKQIYNEFSEKIFEKRLDAYPKLFELLSRFQKDHIDPNVFSQAALIEFLQNLYDLDSKHAILFGKRTGLITYRFRQDIANLASMRNDELVELYKSNEARRDLRHKFNEYELALKTELGIYRSPK